MPMVCITMRYARNKPILYRLWILMVCTVYQWMWITVSVTQRNWHEVWVTCTNYYTQTVRACMSQWVIKSCITWPEWYITHASITPAHKKHKQRGWLTADHSHYHMAHANLMWKWDVTSTNEAIILWQSALQIIFFEYLGMEGTLGIIVIQVSRISIGFNDVSKLSKDKNYTRTMCGRENCLFYYAIYVNDNIVFCQITMNLSNYKHFIRDFCNPDNSKVTT
jgi:hypothetical protein